MTKSFSVNIKRRIDQWTSIDVDAETAEQAGNLALAQAKHVHMWEDNGGQDGSDDDYEITDIDELKEGK